MELLGKVKIDKNTGMVDIMRVTETEELCRKITETINYYKTVASECREEANKTHNEVMDEVRDEMRRKDEELTRAPFHFTAVENERYHAFMRNHYEKGCNCNKGFSLSFVGTGVGTCYDMICNDCGEKEGITDIESW